MRLKTLKTLTIAIAIGVTRHYSHWCNMGGTRGLTRSDFHALLDLGQDRHIGGFIPVVIIVVSTKAAHSVICEQRRYNRWEKSHKENGVRAENHYDS
jgi:hypothetical protein